MPTLLTQTTPKTTYNIHLWIGYELVWPEDLQAFENNKDDLGSDTITNATTHSIAVAHVEALGGALSRFFFEDTWLRRRVALSMSNVVETGGWGRLYTYGNPRVGP